VPGKRVQFDDETWQAIDAVLSRDGLTFQELTDEAFKDALKKHKQPVRLRAALKESVAPARRPSGRADAPLRLVSYAMCVMMDASKR
jgi:hypothetical protein